VIGLLGIDFGSFLGGLLSGLWDLVRNVFGYIIGQVVALVTWILALLPHLPIWPGPSISTAVSQFMSFAAEPMVTWNYYVALNLYLVLAFTALTAEAASAAFKAIRWLIAKLPWVGGEV
jgi:hypothetical protein